MQQLHVDGRSAKIIVYMMKHKPFTSKKKTFTREKPFTHDQTVHR